MGSRVSLVGSEAIAGPNDGELGAYDPAQSGIELARDGLRVLQLVLAARFSAKSPEQPFRLLVSVPQRRNQCGLLQCFFPAIPTLHTGRDLQRVPERRKLGISYMPSMWERKKHDGIRSPLDMTGQDPKTRSPS